MDTLKRLQHLEDCLMALVKMVRDMRAEMSGDPTLVTLETVNYGGYTLQQALFTMLKKWDSKDEKWPVEVGLEKQAGYFKTTKEHICDLISKGPATLRKRFEAYPQSGYKAPVQEEGPPF